MTVIMEAKEQQRMSALQKANDVRVRRRVLKEDVRNGRASVAEILGDPPEWLATMKVADLLCAQRGWGPTKTKKRLAAVHVSANAKVEDLSDTRRRQVIASVTGQHLESLPLPARRVVVELRPRALSVVEEQVLQAVTDLPSTSEHIAMRLAGRHGGTPANLVEILASLERRGFIKSGAAFGGRRGYFKVRERVACAA